MTVCRKLCSRSGNWLRLEPSHVQQRWNVLILLFIVRFEHGVPVSVGGVDVAGHDEGIRRRAGRHRISHQSLSRARARFRVAGRRDRTPLRRQARCSLWSCADQHRRPRDGIRIELGRAGRRAHCRRHRRRAAQRADVQDGDGLVRGQGNCHRDGDLRQFLAGGDRVVPVSGARDRRGKRHCELPCC